LRRTLTIAAAATTLLAAAPAVSHAATYTVTGGKLDWTIANQYTGGSDANRTFLGYLTNATIGGPGASNGALTASSGATLTGPDGAAVATVDKNSPRGTDQLFTIDYPVSASGTLSDEGAGTFELKGTTTWTTHGAPLTLVDPQITLNGLTGVLRASGQKTVGMGTTLGPYDRSLVQFNLDLSKAEVVLRPDGSRTIKNIVPVSTASDTVLAGFPNSARFGAMSLTLGLAYPTQLGSPGAVGPAGPAGPAGKDGKDAAFKVIRLAKAAFATKSEVHVRLIDRVTKKTVATGTVEKKTLRLSVLSGTALKGTYTLKRTAKQAKGKLSTTITI